MRQTIKTLIVVPENNTTMEPEISALCPALAPILVARVKRPARTLLLEDLPTYAEATLDAIEPFAAEQFDLVIYGCTAAGFLGGPSSNARMVDRLRERTRATVVSTAGAMAEALRSAGVSNTAVVTPYLQPINDRPARLPRIVQHPRRDVEQLLLQNHRRAWSDHRRSSS